MTGDHGMRRRRISLGLPLLMRELSDQAGRARHYVLRTVFATVLLLLGYLYLRELLWGGNQIGIRSLGNGPALFNRVISLEAFGILIFLPAMTCGAIAGEKERNTLAVLLTTRLGPATIVMEKLLSRLVLVFSLLLMSLPLLTFAYALGGLSLEYMVRALVWLAALSVMVVTLSLLCSAWCGSSVSAFFMTYVSGVALYVGGFGVFLPFHLGLFIWGGVLPNMRVLLLGVVLPSAAFFLLTVRCLVRRASVTPTNFVLSFFRRLDVLFNRMNVVTGNIVLTRETSTLPDATPIAWRETAKKSLGTVRYLVRVLVTIELPTVFLLLVSAHGQGVLGRGTSVGSLLWLAVWCVAAALIAVMCGSIVSGERMRQTLPVLLSTPIPGDQIIVELFAGVRRLIFVLWIPFATIAAFDYWFHVGPGFATPLSTGVRILCDVLQLTIYPFLIAWATFYLGAKIRSPLWAIVASLLAVSGAVVIPFLVLWLVSVSELTQGLGWWRYAVLASPATIIVANEYASATLVMTCGNFLFFGGLLFLLRRYCLRNADRLLDRAYPQFPAPIAASPALLRDEKEMAPA